MDLLVKPFSSLGMIASVMVGVMMMSVVSFGVVARNLGVVDAGRNIAKE